MKMITLHKNKPLRVIYRRKSLGKTSKEKEQKVRTYYDSS